MHRKYAVAAVVALGVIGTIGVGSAVAGVGPAATLLDGNQHELTAFDATAPHCTDDVSTNSSTAIANEDGATTITHAQNVSLSDPTVTIGEPTFERMNETAWILDVPTEASDRAGAQCLAVARYEASMRIPVDEGPWTVVVQHDGETATTLYGDSNSTGASGSASAGAHVSG